MIIQLSLIVLVLSGFLTETLLLLLIIIVYIICVTSERALKHFF